MRLASAFAALTMAIVPGQLLAGEEISVERGRSVSIAGGCHDCHTVGYNESAGTIDPAKALTGSAVGWQGPWGTSYALNLRIRAATLNEEGFVRYIETMRTLPPMPWYNLREMPESDVRSLYRYIKSLGDPGEQAPAALPPGDAPRTPFVVLVPPQMPAPCTRDLDCGVGEVCAMDEPRACVPK